MRARAELAPSAALLRDQQLYGKAVQVRLTTHANASLVPKCCQSDSELVRARMKVLLIEDEKKIADFVCLGLALRGLHVTHCDNGNTGLAQASQGSFDVLILDIMLPGRDGLSVLKALRDAGVFTPVILLTARNELGDRLTGLNLGADDYLAKPFFVEELVARIHALMRRLAGDRQNILQVGRLTLDRIARQASGSGSGQTIELTTREFNLLEYLMRSAGQVFTRSQILEHVWGYDFDPSTNVVDVCVKRIRGKIAALPGLHESCCDASGGIESVRGVGYRFRQPERVTPLGHSVL